MFKLDEFRAGQYSIRINEKYRICFHWENGYADDVEITDYHWGPPEGHSPGSRNGLPAASNTPPADPPG